jgi:hypothetical protein
MSISLVDATNATTFIFQFQYAPPSAAVQLDIETLRYASPDAYAPVGAYAFTPVFAIDCSGAVSITGATTILPSVSRQLVIALGPSNFVR